MSDFDDRVIAEFRTSGGVVHGFGSGLVLLHSTGPRTREARVDPVAAVQEGGSWLVIGSAAGGPRDPGWAFNLREHPDAVVETPQGSVDVHAIELADEQDWEPAFTRFVARSAGFADHRAKAAPRRMPIFRLEPRG